MYYHISKVGYCTGPFAADIPGPAPESRADSREAARLINAIVARRREKRKKREIEKERKKRKKKRNIQIQIRKICAIEWWWFRTILISLLHNTQPTKEDPRERGENQERKDEKKNQKNKRKKEKKITNAPSPPYASSTYR